MGDNTMRLTKNLIKLLYIHFLFYTVFLFASCPTEVVPKGGPSYPSDIVTSVGTLKYIRTLWDMASILQGLKIDDEIWIYTAGTLFKGIDKSESIPIGFINGNYYGGYPPYMLPKGDYINFLVGKSYNGYDIFYIARVNRATMERQYIRIPKLDGERWPSAFCGNDDVFFEYCVYDDSAGNFIYSYYMLNDTCDDVIEITKQESDDLYSPKPNYVTDDEGRYYRLYHNEVFEVSIDNGTTWHRNTVQDNFPRKNRPKSIIIQNDSIFILCQSVYMNANFGGGIHEFKWETRSKP